MLKSFDLLKHILNDIEQGIRDGVTIGALAAKYSLSERHLHRLFKFAFERNIAGYIRSRKLAASVDDLLNTDLNILDIALDYSFEYEASYIRSFQREYGITPGGLRKTGKIVKITPPLQMFNAQKYPDGVLFGPDIVVVPQFHVIGKKYTVLIRDGVITPQLLAKQFFFWEKERQRIPDMINPHQCIVVTSGAEEDADADYYYFMPAVQVKSLERIPAGFDGYTFPTSLCAKFRFINNNAEEFNLHTAHGMFKAINDFMDSEDQQYFLERARLDINIVNLQDKHQTYGHQGWFSPVIKKTSLKIPPHSPSGIKEAYRQQQPALRFIGKKCAETPEPVNVLHLLDEWQLNRRFDVITQQAALDRPAFFEGADAYIHLARGKDGGGHAHYIGMFTPEGTAVPDGYEAVDFAPMAVGVCRVYGKRDEIVGYEAACRNKLAEEGLAPKNAAWYIRRFNWRQFFKEDVYGKRTLDYCYPLG